MLKSSGFKGMKVHNAENPNRSQFVVCGLWVAFTCMGARHNDFNNNILASTMLHGRELEKQYREEFRKDQLSGNKIIKRNYHEWTTRDA